MQARKGTKYWRVKRHLGLEEEAESVINFIFKVKQRKINETNGTFLL
jgi:hypothetical protein